MRRFILNILTVSIPATLILILASYLVNTHVRHADFRLPPDKHIVVFGPSTSGCAIDPDLIPGVENLSKDGSNIRWDLTFLPRVIEENPQIDTVLICLGRHTAAFNKFSPPKSVQWMRSILPSIVYDPDYTPWDILLSHKYFYAAILIPIDQGMIKKRFFEPSYRNHITDYLKCPHNVDSSNLWDDDANNGINGYQKKSQEHGGNIYTQQEIERDSYEITQILNQAIAYCQQKGITPVIFQPPLYQYDRWVSPEGYYGYLKDNFDNNVLISDYENFVFPDDSYYGDVHHLNKYGSEYLSKHIATHGFQSTTIAEWLRDKPIN